VRQLPTSSNDWASSLGLRAARYSVAYVLCGLRESAATEFFTRSKDRLEKNVSWSEQYATGQSLMGVADGGDEGIHAGIAPNRHQGSRRTSAPASFAARSSNR
jgi:hypothetical protein